MFFPAATPSLPDPFARQAHARRRLVRIALLTAGVLRTVVAATVAVGVALFGAGWARAASAAPPVAVAGMAALAGSIAVPAPPPPPPAAPQRPALVLLRLADQHRLEVHPFDGEGAAQLEAFQAIDAFFRASSGHEVLVDPALVDLLMRVQQELAGEPLVLVSGHRQPGRGTSGKSYHVRGMAADVAAPRAGVQELRRAALRAGAGGVGLYPHFVHIDARTEPYRWVGGRWPRRR
jgi:uncharacterized protein YcbK (DUF882 family)